MSAPQSSSIKQGILSRLPQNQFNHSHPSLLQYINSLSQDISAAWNLWNLGLLTDSNDVEGSGIGVFIGIGKGGPLKQTVPFHINHTWQYASYEYYKVLAEAITAEFSKTFSNYCSGFEQFGVQYIGASLVIPGPLPPPTPGPIIAAAIPTILIAIKKSAPSLTGLAERINDRLPDKWKDNKDPRMKLLQAIEDTIVESHNIWELSSLVAGDLFSTTGQPPLGKASGKSTGTGKVI